MRCIFIYNPVSGKGKIAKKLSFIVEELKKKYEIVDVHETTGAGDMTATAKVALNTYDAIIFAGGDGSFNEVIQGLADKENLPELGYIPSGTVNDIAHTLKIPKNIKKALKIIQTGRVESLDCMRVNDVYAMYVVAAGAFTSATYKTSQKQKNHVGRLAYWWHGARKNLRFQVFKIRCENGEQQIETHAVLSSFINSRYVAGFGFNKKTANLQDGKIEVAIVKQTESPNFFRKVGALVGVARLFLFGYKTRCKRVIRLNGSRFDIEVDDDIIWNFDGEKGQNGKICIEVVPRKIKMIVPSNLKRV
ncbi:MAG: YegS/Rv2252/BmrU family lipid kinase [Clostridia bacterium]|nr:YegS/Rv2252/BmrU family lipid kinase [Clostridia bacterium]